jgi:hypothetical protein
MVPAALFRGVTSSDQNVLVDGAMNAISENAAPNPAYGFRPRVIGAEHNFRLTQDALEYEVGNHKRQILYKDIERVRLSFSPANFSLRRFVTEIWPREGGKISIVSVSAQNAFNFENRGAAYRAFMIELCRRIGIAQPGFQIESGMPRWRWLPAAIFAAGTLVALAYLLVRALFNAEFGFFVFCLIFGALFISQIGTMLFRNRPRSCGVNSIPAEVLPSL